MKQSFSSILEVLYLENKIFFNDQIINFLLQEFSEKKYLAILLLNASGTLPVHSNLVCYLSIRYFLYALQCIFIEY